MALIDDFKSRFPEFDDAVVDQYLPVLEPVYPCYFGGNYEIPCDKEAILNLLAHLLVLEERTKQSSLRTTQSRSAGGVSVSYDASANGRDTAGFFDTTKYGQRFLVLTQSNVGGFFV